MRLHYVKLLEVVRELYSIPRGIERFDTYIRTFTDPMTGQMTLPLAGMNPMGKEHLLPFIDGLITLNADGIAEEATLEAEERLRDEPGAYKVCVVVSDDLMGGWTNRYTAEFDGRFRQTSIYQRGWIVSLVWTGDKAYSAQRIREEVLASIFRAAYMLRHGRAFTLRAMLAQEGYALAQGRATAPTLDLDDLAYTRTVLAQYLNASDKPTVLVALFGDDAAKQLGYQSLGLSPRAGLALARADYGNQPL
ncbi:MAG: hypothetical protein EXR67_03625 [Dehalococcoidia bacterium]|nr:hypothetical protein [Dehalococcoidia bacterium]